MTSVRPKLSPETPKLVTAWDVLSGRSVYRTAAGGWSEDIGSGEVLTGEAADTALSAAKTEEAVILDPYLMEVCSEGKIAGRETLRETIRAIGPTTHPELQKPVREKQDAKSSNQSAHFVWG